MEPGGFCIEGSRFIIFTGFLAQLPQQRQRSVRPEAGFRMVTGGRNTDVQCLAQRLLCLYPSCGLQQQDAFYMMKGRIVGE
ncbi:hypothetical protein D3C75_854440 [compost metagenome]